MSTHRTLASPWIRAVLVTLVVVALIVFGLRLVLSSASMRASIRTKVYDTLSKRVGAVEVGDDYAVGLWGSVSMGPVRLPGSTAQEPPVLEIQLVTVRPRFWALLLGRVEPASIHLDGLALNTGWRGSELFALADRIARLSDETTGPKDKRAASSADLQLSFSRAVVTADALRGGASSRLEAGPISGWLHLRRKKARTIATAEVQLPHGDGLIHVEGRRDSTAPGTVKAFWEKVDLRDVLGLALSAESVQVAQGVADGTATIELAADGSAGSLSAQTHVRDVFLLAARLSDEAVGPFRGSVSMKADALARGTHLRLERFHVVLGDSPSVAADFSADLRRGEGGAFAFEARALTVDYAALLDALPPKLQPEPDARLTSGTFGLSVEASGPLARPEEWELKGKLELAGLKAEAGRSGLARLKSEFTHEVQTKDGRTRRIVVGLRNPNFVPFSKLPRTLVTAVLVSEDSSFLSHHGIDFKAVRNSLVANAQSGTVVRGASTLTQQLAKNLFLGRERTVVRKLREALLTLGLEAALSKERLLEIYFNIIEWGPGLYGIKEAARHYFEKEPAQLTPKEAAFLATLIPGPVKYHSFCFRGELTELWEANVAAVMEKMVTAGVLTEAQYEQHVLTRLVFSRPEYGEKAGRSPHRGLEAD
jgi:hypothetical protein